MLSRSTTRMRPDICFHPQSQDQPRRRSWGESQRCHRASPEKGSPVWSPTHSLTGSPWWVTFLDPETSEEDQAAGQPLLDLIWGPCQGWNQTSSTSCRSWPPHKRSVREVMSHKGPQQKTMKSGLSGGWWQVHTPNWWWELVGILGINDFQELAWKIRVFFEIPWARNKAQDVDNNYLAPPAPKSICQKEFMPLQNLTFPSQDFREGQSQKTLVYMQALQYWVEKASLPKLGQPHLLVKCVQELRHVMEPYVTFTDDAVLEGAAPWERFPEGQPQAPTPVETLAAPSTKELESTQVMESAVPPLHRK